MESYWVPIISGVFGLLLTAIGVLVYARLVFITSQIDKIWQEYGAEAAARETRWRLQFTKCSAELTLLSRLIGVLEGKGILPAGWGERYNPKE